MDFVKSHAKGFSTYIILFQSEQFFFFSRKFTAEKLFTQYQKQRKRQNKIDVRRECFVSLFCKKYDDDYRNEYSSYFW